MAKRLFEAALQNRLLTIILVLVIVGLGGARRSGYGWPIDAVA